MHRRAYGELLEWKDSPDRKPLLLEGVRQCGKTFLLKEFGRKEFDSMVYVNFERVSSVGALFEGDLDPEAIVRNLEIVQGRRIVPGRTLLILDEIQGVPSALTSLKYFAEEMPELHVACAGSLLGPITSKPNSFPVGKVDRIRLYPMDFLEFLYANDEGDLARYIMDKGEDDTVSQPIHDRLEPYLREYYLVGGMPAAVSSWVKNHNISAVTRILKNIVMDYRDDFSKHAGDELQNVIHVWNSISSQISRENQKFMFGHAKPGARAKDLEKALTWLIDAGLVYKVCCVESPAVPLSGVCMPTHFKLYMADVGILRVMSGKGGEVMSAGTGDDHLFRGALAENHVLCQMLSGGAERAFYWRRNGLEVDFLIDGRDGPIPVEVKAETKVDAKSLMEYISDYRPGRAFVTSMRRGGGDACRMVPLYCSVMIPTYCGIGSISGQDVRTDVATGPYRRNFTAGDWTEDGSGHFLTIPRREHGIASPGTIQVFAREGDLFREVQVMKIVDLEGDVTLRSNRSFDGFVSIL